MYVICYFFDLKFHLFKASIRYGMRCTQLMYSHSTVFVACCVFLIGILLAVSNYNNDWKKCLGILLFLMCTTLRSKAWGIAIAIVLICYFTFYRKKKITIKTLLLFVPLVVTFKRKIFDFTVAILLLLIFFESLVAISTHSVYMPYAPVDILIWPISVIVYYNYSYYYDITKIAQNKAIWFFFAMCAIAVPLIKIHLSGAGNIGQVIFPTYFCITTLPLVLILTNNRSCRNLSMVMAVLISTASTKRAGTLALILGLFVMFVVEAHIQGTLNQRWKKYLKIMLLILIGTIMVFYLESTGRIQILDRFARLGDDGGSGIDFIWSIVLNAYHS